MWLEGWSCRKFRAYGRVCSGKVMALVGQFHAANIRFPLVCSGSFNPMNSKDTKQKPPDTVGPNVPLSSIKPYNPALTRAPGDRRRHPDFASISSKVLASRCVIRNTLL